MDEVVQVPVEIPQAPVDLQTKRPFIIKRFLDVGSWAALFILTPFFFIAFLSQNSFPGDFLYPVKRGIENSLLAAASVSPTTKAFFQTDIADRRFTEAETLLLSQANTEPLNDLVAQVESTQVAIENVSDPVKQEELTTKVIAQIDAYQAKLTNTAAQIQSSTAPFAQAPTQIQTNNTVQISPSPTQVVTIVQIITSTPIPTQLQLPPAIVTPPAATPLIEVQKKQVEEAVNVTKIRLEKIKKDLEEKSKQREDAVQRTLPDGKNKDNNFSR